MTRWTYDDAGNITEQARVTDAGTETDTRTYNNLNQLETSSGGWTYQYDLDGNLTEKNNGTSEGCEKWEFGWNENCRLVQVKKGVYDATPALVNAFTVDYQYDEMGRMLRRDDGTDVTDYFWDHWDLFRETTGESVTEYLVPGLGIQSFLRDGDLFALHTDALGSTRTVTDATGSVVARMELGAWGETLAGSADSVPGGLPMGFVGALGVRRDGLTGMVWMRKRWYDVGKGRFVSRDPIGLSGGSNLYNYALCSPNCYSDPMGLKPGCMSDEEKGLLRLLQSGKPILMSADTHFDYRPKQNYVHIYSPQEWAGIQARARAQRDYENFVFGGLGTQQLILGFGAAATGNSMSYSNAPRVGPSASIIPRSAPPNRVGLDANAIIDITEWQRPVVLQLVGNRRPDLSPIATRQVRDGGPMSRTLLRDFIFRTGAICDGDFAHASGERIVRQAGDIGRVILLPDASIAAHAMDRGHTLINGDDRINSVLRNLGLGGLVEPYQMQRVGPRVPRT